MEGSEYVFDDLAYDFDEEAAEEDVKLLVGLVHLVGIVVALWCCCCPKRGRCLCCRLPPEPEATPGDGPYIASAHELQPKKRVLTSYILWLFLGVLGAHHFYLGRIFHGVLVAWSGNFCGAGWLVDMVMIPSYVKWFNDRYTAPSAEYDKSRRKVLCQVPLALVALVGALLGLVVYTPWLLHVSGAVDIDRIAAQTSANPYELLGLSRGATLADAKQAYRRESLRWHPDRNLGCGKECDQKMFEITKAFELIKKRQAPPPPDRSWEAWLQDVGSDWWHIIEVLAQQDEEYHYQQQEQRRHRRPPEPGREGGGKAAGGSGTSANGAAGRAEL